VRDESTRGKRGWLSRNEEHSNAEFSDWMMDGATITGTRFTGCRFTDASLMDSHFTNVDFIRCNLFHARFDRARFVNCTFDTSALSRASFHSTRLERVRFLNCDIVEADIGGATFHDCDVSVFSDGKPAHSPESPVLDWRSICRSIRARDLAAFLVRYGMPELMATYLADSARALDPNMLFRLMRSTFISYGGPDSAFALRLRDRLHSNGVSTFFFETDALAGQKLHTVMRNGINAFDRVVLVCSRASLRRPGVRNEIEETLAREARDGGASYLIPITLDDYIFKWDDPLAQPICDRVVADFRGHEHEDAFSEAVARLLKALRAD
jgi:hypothetical protein